MLVAQREVFTSNLSSSSILDRLKRAAASGEYRPVPGDLRSYGVYALRFTLKDEDRFVVDMLGFRNAPRAAASIEGRGRVISTPGGPSATEIHFEVGADLGTFLGLGGIGVFLGAVVVADVVRTGQLAATANVVVPILGMFVFTGMAWFQTGFLASRAWPGLVELMQQLAAGRLE